MNPLFRQPVSLWLARNLVTIGDIIDIFATVHRLPVSKNDMLLSDTEYFENLVRKPKALA